MGIREKELAHMCVTADYIHVHHRRCSGLEPGLITHNTVSFEYVPHAGTVSGVNLTQTVRATALFHPLVLHSQTLFLLSLLLRSCLPPVALVTLNESPGQNGLTPFCCIFER